LIAAKHHGGGLSTGWIAAIVVVIALLIVLFVATRGRPEPDEETLRGEAQADLERRLGPLYDADCRSMCLWLAKGSLGHQQALYDALAAQEEIDPVQGDDGEA
jgi:hypothetical protein